MGGGNGVEMVGLMIIPAKVVVEGNTAAVAQWLTQEGGMTPKRSVLVALNHFGYLGQYAQKRLGSGSTSGSLAWERQLLTHTAY